MVTRAVTMVIKVVIKMVTRVIHVVDLVVEEVTREIQAMVRVRVVTQETVVMVLLWETVAAEIMVAIPMETGEMVAAEIPVVTIPMETMVEDVHQV